MVRGAVIPHRADDLLRPLEDGARTIESPHLHQRDRLTQQGLAQTRVVFGEEVIGPVEQRRGRAHVVRLEDPPRACDEVIAGPDPEADRVLVGGPSSVRCGRPPPGVTRRSPRIRESIAHPDQEPVREALVELRPLATEHARVGGLSNQEMRERDCRIVEERGDVERISLLRCRASSTVPMPVRMGSDDIAATAPVGKTWPTTAPHSSTARSCSIKESRRAARSAWMEGGIDRPPCRLVSSQPDDPSSIVPSSATSRASARGTAVALARRHDGREDVLGHLHAADQAAHHVLALVLREGLESNSHVLFHTVGPSG